MEITKSEIESKEIVEDQIKQYSQWFNGLAKGFPKPKVHKKVIEIVEKGIDYTFKNKTNKEIQEEKRIEKEERKKLEYQGDREKWLNEVVRPFRNQKIIECENVFQNIKQRHEREKRMGLTTTFSEEQYGLLLTEKDEYISFLSYITKIEYTEEIKWPSKPSFMQ